MTTRPRCIAPDNTLVEAAGLMRELDVGALPICDNDRLAGMVTDRDIVLRGTADGRDPNSTAVREVMSTGIVFVFADQSVEEAARIMEEKQIRRLPVLNREKRLVGIVSLGDVATSSNPAFSGSALRDVSQSGHPTGRQRRLLSRSAPARMPTMAGERRRPGAGKKRAAAERDHRKSPAGKKAAHSPRQRRAVAKPGRPRKSPGGTRRSRVRLRAAA